MGKRPLSDNAGWSPLRPHFRAPFHMAVHSWRLYLRGTVLWCHICRPVVVGCSPGGWSTRCGMVVLLALSSAKWEQC
jgi:hypothetical protein